MTEDDDDDGPDAWHNQPTPRPVRRKKVVRQDRMAHHGIPKPIKPWKRKKYRPRNRAKPAEDPMRLSPAYRKNVRYKTIIMPEEAYIQLKEMALFYKLSISQMAVKLIEPAFAKAYEESMTLARIEANRQKEKERAETKTSDDDKPPRRTHF